MSCSDDEEIILNNIMSNLIYCLRGGLKSVPSAVCLKKEQTVH